MRIGALLPFGFPFVSPFHGVREQARYQMAAVQNLGVDVTLLDMWKHSTLDRFDVIHYFNGGSQLMNLALRPLPTTAALVFATMIDSNQSFLAYRAAAEIGQRVRGFFTVPGLVAMQAKAADLVVVRSTHERDRVVRGLGTPADRVKIVLNGVDAPASADVSLLADLNLPARFVLHVSTYTQARKNALNLVKACRQANLPLVVVGKVEDAKLKRLIDQAAGTDGLVRFMEPVERPVLEALYAACDVFALPSVHEGTGLVALEAAALGAKVVITHHGGPPDYFGGHAEYVEPDDLPGIIAALRAAWENPKTDALRQHVRGTLTWKQSGEQLIAAYEQAIAHRKRQA